MRLFGVDTSLKWINFELDEVQYSVHFKWNLFKGIYEVSIWKNGNKIKAKIGSAYPPLVKILSELWQVWLPVKLKAIEHQLYKNLKH